MKPYDVVLYRKAEKELDSVPADYFPKVDKAIRSLSHNPRPFGSKKLDRDLYRIRVGAWRVIYTVEDAEHRIAILHVGRRSEKTYKNLRL